MYGLIAVGLGNSIMFPTIFALAIRGLGPLTEEGSGLLIMSIAGGALVFIQGSIADRFGLQWAFIVTALCSLYVLFYALWGCRPTNALPDGDGRDRRMPASALRSRHATRERNSTLASRWRARRQRGEADEKPGVIAVGDVRSALGLAAPAVAQERPAEVSVAIDTAASGRADRAGDLGPVRRASRPRHLRGHLGRPGLADSRTRNGYRNDVVAALQAHPRAGDPLAGRLLRRRISTGATASARARSGRRGSTPIGAA